MTGEKNAVNLTAQARTLTPSRQACVAFACLAEDHFAPAAIDLVDLYQMTVVAYESAAGDKVASSSPWQ